MIFKNSLDTAPELSFSYHSALVQIKTFALFAFFSPNPSLRLNDPLIFPHNPAIYSFRSALGRLLMILKADK